MEPESSFGKEKILGAVKDFESFGELLLFCWKIPWEMKDFLGAEEAFL